MLLIMLGCGFSILTIVIHAIGMTGGIEIFKHVFVGKPKKRSLGSMIGTLCLTGLYLLILHLIESVCWAIAYLTLPAVNGIDSFEEAVYFSMVTFSSLGYGDVVIEAPHRILCGIEAMNGLLIFGWSTAMFMTLLQRLWQSYSIEENGE